MKLLYTLLFSFFFLSLYAQRKELPYSPYTYVYEINEAEADTFYRRSGNSFRPYDRHFHTLRDSFKQAEEAYQFPASGHFITASLQGKNIHTALLSFNSIQAEVLNNRKDFTLQVFDSTGLVIKNAEVNLDGKEVPFEEASQAYRLEKHDRGGLLKIKTEGESAYYQVFTTENKGKLLRRLERFSYTKFGRIITSPLRVGKGLVYYFKRGFGNWNWRIYNWRRLIPFRGLFRKKDKSARGYLVLSQPKYQPGDTLKVKAYLTNRKGKPLQGKKTLNLKTGTYPQKNILKKEITSDAPGNYTLEYVLGDSLKIDQKYAVNIGPNLMASFYLEDYQLDEVTWNLKAAKEVFLLNDKVVILAEGSDANGNTIPDGEVQISVLQSQVQEVYTETAFIPDTIFQSQIYLRTRGETEILLPDSIFSGKKMTLCAVAKFRNSNGETAKKTLYFKVSKRPNYFRYSLSQDSLKVNYFKNGKKTKAKGKVSIYNDENRILKKLTTEFPAVLPLMPTAAYYRLQCNDLSKDVFSSVLKTRVRFSGQYKTDSVSLNLQNPQQLQVHYLIEKGNKVIAQGLSTAPNDLFVFKSKPDDVWYITWNYLLAGEEVSDKITLRKYKNQLNLEVEQAAEVKPGAKEEIKISVLDYRGKPAKKVNLTAAAINAQFNKTLPFTQPEVKYKKVREPFRYNKFKLRKKKLYKHSGLLNQMWYENLELDSLLFYKMRFSDQGLLIQQDTVLDNPETAQFAVFLFDGTKELPVHLLYCNRRLIYYSAVNPNQPYSFIGNPGRNVITVRSHKAEYTLRNIILKKGYKTEIILNTAYQEELIKNKKLEVNKRGSELSPRERMLLKKSLFQIKAAPSRTGQAYLWQDKNQVFIFEASRNTQTFGPFRSDKGINYLLQEKFFHRVDFDPGYIYQLSPGREKLFPGNDNNYSKNTRLSSRAALRSPGEEVFTYSDIISKPARERRLAFGSSDFKHKKGGRLLISTELPQDTALWFLLVENEGDSLRHAINPKDSTLYNLAPGNYKLSYFTRNEYCASTTLEIKSGGLNWINWKDFEFKKDSTGLVRLLRGYEENQHQENLPEEFYSFRANHKTGLIGRVRQSDTETGLEGIRVKVEKQDIFIAEVYTDLSGKYKIPLAPGAYHLSLYQGSLKKAEFPIYIKDSTVTIFDWMYAPEFEGSHREFWFDAVTVTGQRVPLITADRTSIGRSVSSEDIRKLPTRNIHALTGKVAGVTLVDEGDNISIRGSRSDGTYYYIDGVRVSGKIQPQEPSFKSRTAPTGNRVISGIVKEDETGEVLIGANVIAYYDKQVIGGTVTDIDGQYSLRGLPEGLISIEVNYVGFAPQKIDNIVSNNNVDFNLSGGVSLDEVVVVGAAAITNSRRDDPQLDLSISERTKLTGLQMRTDFKDYAYWQPNLRTNRKGEAQFLITYPDNITAWNNYFIGQDHKNRGGIYQSQVKAVKPLTASLSIPRFLLKGDTTTIIGKTVNYTEDEFTVRTSFAQGETTIKSQEQVLSEALIEQSQIQAIQTDTLKVSYQVRTGDYGDGETRDLPVFPVGTEENEGNFCVLRGDTSLTLNTTGKINIYADSDPLPFFLQDIKYLRNYRYGCNEQTASKLIALLLEKEVARTLGKKWLYEKDIRFCLARLQRNQNPEGSWGWWQHNKGEMWMTTYVLRALAKAEQAGYKTKAKEIGLRYLTACLDDLDYEGLLNALYLLSDIEQNTDYERYIQKLEQLRREKYTINGKTLKIPFNTDDFILTDIKQAQGLDYDLSLILSKQKSTLFGGAYWGEKRFHWIQNELQMTRIAYRIFRREGNAEMQSKILQFYMEKRNYHFGSRFGRNTFETAEILNLLLPDILKKSKSKDFKNILTLNGEVIASFPYRKVFENAESIELQKTGGGNIYFTSYRTYFNSNPQKVDSIYEVSTQILQKGKVVKQLKQGEKAEILVKIKAKRSSSHVMIEVPIPAGCSYGAKNISYRQGEVHREYFKEKTAIFCRSLGQGEYTFKIELEPRFTGSFTLNPAKVEQMYFPVFYGRNEVKRVGIGNIE